MAANPRRSIAFAKACGADAFCCERPDDVRPAISAALLLSKPVLVELLSKPVLVEAVVDANEKPKKPDEFRA
jgi:thiamine pyrophosphate-dependent acetolactate synthase large subunit-like protein